jgi:CDP-diglyceride synthetase
MQILKSDFFAQIVSLLLGVLLIALGSWGYNVNADYKDPNDDSKVNDKTKYALWIASIGSIVAGIFVVLGALFFIYLDRKKTSTSSTPSTPSTATVTNQA